jgi:predicted dehydrogenase
MGEQDISRRDFMKAAAGAGAATYGLTALGAAAPSIPAAKSFRVGLIGCGGRGSGALKEHVEAGKTLGVDIKVAATADYFKDRAEKTGKAYGVPPERCFGGPDSYRKLIEAGVDIVLDAAPPLFRPGHFVACVEAGKHVFMEKPIAVDPPGCRAVMDAGLKAAEKGLTVVAGTNMRHEKRFIDTHQAVAVEGVLGKLYGGRVSFCIAHMFWKAPIQPKSAEDLIRSWQNWIELSGDHLVEQHVHNIDIANWFVGRPPASAVGFGGRARRPAGNMYDFFSVDFDYGDGVHIHSMCRQVSGCWNWTGQELVYEKGTTTGSDRAEPKKSPIPADLPQVNSGHLQEHLNLLYYLTRGKPLNQARAVAEATAAAILGRIAAYTGQNVFWRSMMDDPNKNPELYNMKVSPSAEDFEKGTVKIPEEGVIPIPGKKA